MNYSHLHEADSISRGDLYVALQNISIFKSLGQAEKRLNKSTTSTLSASEVYTISVNNTLILDDLYSEDGNFRKCLLPMPGWIHLPEAASESSQAIHYGLVQLKVRCLLTCDLTQTVTQILAQNIY